MRILKQKDIWKGEQLVAMEDLHHEDFIEVYVLQQLLQSYLVIRCSTPELCFRKRGQSCTEGCKELYEIFGKVL